MIPSSYKRMGCALLMILLMCVFVACMESENEKPSAKAPTKIVVKNEKAKKPFGFNKKSSKQADVRQEMSYNVTVSSKKPEYVALRFKNIFEKLEIATHEKISLTKPFKVEIVTEKYLEFLKNLQDLKSLRVKREPVERKTSDPNTIIFNIEITQKK